MLALIDSDYIPFLASYDKVGKTKKTLEECILHCDELVNTIFRETKCTHYILALTVGKCFRYKIYPEYKANRKYKQELKYFKEVKQYLIDKWGAIYNTNLEADDIVNIYKTKYEDSFIISTDKDLLSLEGESYNPKTKQWIINSKYKADKAFATSLIVGDSADNIKGIKGLGISASKKLLDGKTSERELLNTVFDSYITNNSNIDEAIDDFFVNYKCLRIVNKLEGFEFIEPIAINIIPKDEFEKRMVKE